MARIKVIATLKSNDNISIIVEIEDIFHAEDDEGRITEAYKCLRHSSFLKDFYFRNNFRREFDFSFE